MATVKPLVDYAGSLEDLKDTDNLPSSEVLQLTNANAGTAADGMVVYKNGTADSVDLARANASGTSEFFGIVDQSGGIATTVTGSIRYGGVKAMADWSAVQEGASTTLTVGATYYVSPTTAGKITSTCPTTAGQYVMKIGVAKSTTELLLQRGVRIAKH